MKMKKKILIVQSIYYKEISNGLRNGAINYINKHKDNFTLEILDAPGSFEIPFIINKNNEKFDGFVALGCIIKGETYHFELISNEVARKIMDLNISINKPIGFGILTCDNIEQARIRSDINKKNKGAEAARACIAMLIHKNYG